MEPSLDHFLQTRGVKLLGISQMGRSWKAHTTAGALILAGGAAMAVTPLLGGPSEIVYGAIGPAIAGLINIAIGLNFRRTSLDIPNDLLSPEAKALLRVLVIRSSVWSNGTWRPRNGAHYGPQAWPGMQPVSPPAPEVMTKLDAAAAAHNAIVAVIGDATTDRQRKILNAADSGMADAFHLAAVSPSQPKAIEQLNQTVLRLEELAVIVSREANADEVRTNLRSTLDTTLEELRAEDVALRELGQ